MRQQRGLNKTTSTCFFVRVLAGAVLYGCLSDSPGSRAGVAGCGAPHCGWGHQHHLLDSGGAAAGTGWVPDPELAVASASCHPALCPRHHQHLALNRVVTMEQVLRRPSYLDLFQTSQLRHISLCFMVLWFGVNFSYYGVTLDLSGLGLTVYQTQLLLGAVELPSKIAVYFLVRHVGRRLTETGMLLCTALTFGLSLLVSPGTKTSTTALVVMAKAFSEAAFTTAYLFTSELYPTVLRQDWDSLRSWAGSGPLWPHWRSCWIDMALAAQTCLRRDCPPGCLHCAPAP